MKAGKLRHQVILQRNQSDRNDLGEPQPGWTDYATVDAEVSPLVGKEFYSAQQVNAELNTRVRMRWLPGVKAGDQVRFSDRTLLIASPPINVNEKNHELVLMCRELL